LDPGLQAATHLALGSFRHIIAGSLSTLPPVADVQVRPVPGALVVTATARVAASAVALRERPVNSATLIVRAPLPAISRRQPRRPAKEGKMVLERRCPLLGRPGCPEPGDHHCAGRFAGCAPICFIGASPAFVKTRSRITPCFHASSLPWEQRGRRLFIPWSAGAEPQAPESKWPPRQDRRAADQSRPTSGPEGRRVL
jgi:hypothetical protein